MQVFKFIEGRSKNRRINIWALEEDGEVCFVVETKRLVDFKTREILHTRTQLSFYTFKLLQEFMFFMVNDPEFKKVTNRFNRQFEENQMHAKTNCKQ